jgi:hypothetical protein
VSAELLSEVLLFVAEVETRHAKANSGPIDVHRYDNDGGSIAYQLQQSGRGEDSVVLCAFDDDDNPRARHDAEFAAKAWTDVPALCRLVHSRQELLDQAIAAADVAATALEMCAAENATLCERIAKLEARSVHVERETLLDLLVRMGNHVYVTGGDAEALSLEDIHQEIFKFQNELTDHKTGGLKEDLAKLESAARFAYDTILSSSVCDEHCDCIDCQILETLGEALDIPRIGET